jgi:hypothetical protein
MPQSRGTARGHLLELSVWSSISGDVSNRGGAIETRFQRGQPATTSWLTRRIGPVATQRTTLVPPRPRPLTYAHRIPRPLLRQKERK